MDTVTRYVETYLSKTFKTVTRVPVIIAGDFNAGVTVTLPEGNPVEDNVYKHMKSGNYLSSYLQHSSSFL